MMEPDARVSLDIDPHEGYIVVSFAHRCRLTSSNVGDFRAQILANYRPGQALILNCQNLELIDSAALSVLIHVRKRIVENGGVLKLAHVGESILKLLEITRLHRVFEVHDSIDSAISALGEKPVEAERRRPETIHLRVRHTPSFTLVHMIHPDALVAANCMEFRDKIKEYLQRSDTVILNFDAVTNIDSAGVATLIHLKKVAREHRKQILLVCKNRILNRLFRIYSLDRLFPTFATDAGAIRVAGQRTKKKEAAEERAKGDAAADSRSAESDNGCHDISLVPSCQEE